MVIFYKLVLETQIFSNKEKYNVFTLSWEKCLYGDATDRLYKTWMTFGNILPDQKLSCKADISFSAGP